ncbi:magnesium/cobalt transporter CorA [Bacillus sp. DTU_2020_1000418_1_SI_GHA_SEK_038]|uniref:magnesium/cobalt transporter CorA n=1 Tax=Bacillus sp. DTU_2020_1000418_1_SI_GHA_SEK_038 TaxID=3077585 RepID=UPI0028F1130C|nr:magnesium/cobalt transporter CorA [Bacillus sp. DTU_2020_1000418_1_SI_GHA_SEK_038]WNS73554.1 magnesium/cobalt transporter CorA [Bacillus sp. DTU_2020_1000418_1_SI_GHA_SEK_038]
MIRSFSITSDYQLAENLPIEQLFQDDIKWFWIDFESPTEEETNLLKTHFNFHPLAIDDCLHLLQRPKLDYYEGYDFYVIHTLNQHTLLPEEVDVFVGKNFIVTFHLTPSSEITIVRQKLLADDFHYKKGALHLFYQLMDKIVDEYFPAVYKIEDKLNEIELKDAKKDLMNNVFELRSQLLKLRRTIFPMRELLYRILNSERVIIPKDERMYFMDIYDHLLKLSEMIESNREMTKDIRDSYLSINSDRMNNIMKTLTVMSSIFIPLTFIASIYGMNFEYMPELTWKWGYFGVLGVMLLVGSTLLFVLWRMGWFK